MARRKIPSPLAGGKKYKAGARIFKKSLVTSFKISKGLVKLVDQSVSKPRKRSSNKAPVPRAAQQKASGCVWIVVIVVLAYVVYLVL